VHDVLKFEDLPSVTSLQPMHRLQHGNPQCGHWPSLLSEPLGDGFILAAEEAIAAINERGPARRRNDRDVKGQASECRVRQSRRTPSSNAGSSALPNVADACLIRQPDLLAGDRRIGWISQPTADRHVPNADWVRSFRVDG